MSKIFTDSIIACPYCEGHGYFTMNDHRGDPEYDYDVSCPKCNGGEIQNDFQSQDSMRKLAREIWLKSEEMKILATDYYATLAKKCEDIDYALSASRYLDDKEFDSMIDIDVECQELNAMFDAFDVKRTTFAKMLEECSTESDFDDAKNFDVEKYLSDSHE
jgi:hypothetical protein